MFKKVLVALMFLSFIAYAEEKYAFVDVVKVMNTSKEGKKLRKEIEEKFKYYQSKAKEVEEEIKQLKQQLESPLLSEEAKKEKEQKLQELQSKITTLTVEAQKTLNEMKLSAERKLAKKIELIVKDYAQKHNIDIVFARTMVDPILFADSSIDITDQVIKLMDESQNENN